MSGRRYAVVAAIVAGVVLVDQLTKTWAVDALADGPIHVFWTLRFALSFNSGFAFSMGTGLTPFITVAAVVLVAVLVSVTRHATTRLLAVALGFLLGGALGNLADRLFRSHGGAVVDFIDFQWWPVFNVADMAISIGAVLLVIASFIDDHDDRDDRPDPLGAGADVADA